MIITDKSNQDTELTLFGLSGVEIAKEIDSRKM